jgi:hypothetical protein
MSAKHIPKRSREPDAVPRGRADLRRLRRLSDREIAKTSPSDLRDLPEDFWDDAEVVVPPSKQAVSLRLDQMYWSGSRSRGPSTKPESMPSCGPMSVEPSGPYQPLAPGGHAARRHELPREAA